MAHSHSASDGNRSRLLAAFLVTAVYMVAEVIGGILSGSLALLADAGHMLTDSAALLFALVAVHLAQRRPSKRHSYGLLRLTTLAAFVNALALLAITVLIVWEAVIRFAHPQPVAGGMMLTIATGGLLANLLSFWLLHRGSGEKNLNVRAAALHVLGDLLGSVGAIIAALIILFTGWTPIDPILSILVSMLVLRSGWILIKESSHELLEGAPPSIDIDKLRRSLTQNIPEVRNVHHVHLWQVGEKPVITLHVQVIPPRDHDALLRRIHHYLHAHFHLDHATVQMEYQRCEKEDCDSDWIRGGPSHDHHGHPRS